MADGKSLVIAKVELLLAEKMATLAAVGGYLIFRSIGRIHRIDYKIEKIKKDHKFMNNLMVE